MADYYGSVADFKSYCDARGDITYQSHEDAEIEAALLRASEYIDGRYRTMFPGRPAVLREDGGQPREWPRVSSIGLFGSLVDIYGSALPEGQTPVEVQSATYEIAIRELVRPGVMQPDVRKSDRIQSAAVSGAVSVTYGGVASIEDYKLVVTSVLAILAPILTGSGSTSGLAGKRHRV